MSTLVLPTERFGAAAGERRQFRAHDVQVSRMTGRLTVLCMSVALATLILGAYVLLEQRWNILAGAEQASGNLVLTLERDIARTISVYDLSLQGTARALDIPGIDQISPALRQAAVFDSAATAEFLGSLLVLNAAGDIVVDSTSVIPHQLNYADMDFFRVHAERADLGLYIGPPVHSRLRNGDPTLTLSRRLSAPDGHFTGVVSGALRIAYFRELFSRLSLGSKGGVSIYRTDGLMIARYPFNEADMGRDMSASANFRHIAASAGGSFTGTAIVDGVTRFYTFRHVSDLPLIVIVGLSVDDLYAGWWLKAGVIAALLIVLCGTTMWLGMLFRRETRRRIAAEHGLVKAVERLSRMATTDPLTGIANRRAFDTVLRAEWARAIRTEAPIALLMVDADCFKLYNDRYGHPDGDRVLRSIATSLRQALRRPTDLVARYGGEEFVVLLPGEDYAGASAIAECMRSAVAGLHIAHAGSPSGRVTVSIGMAVASPGYAKDPDLLVKAADEALYDAKRAGRNRVGVAGRGVLSPT